MKDIIEVINGQNISAVTVMSIASYLYRVSGTKRKLRRLERKIKKYCMVAGLCALGYFLINSNIIHF